MPKPDQPQPRKGMQGIVDPTNICRITTSGHPDTYPSPYVYVNQGSAKFS